MYSFTCKYCGKTHEVNTVKESKKQFCNPACVCRYNLKHNVKNRDKRPRVVKNREATGKNVEDNVEKRRRTGGVQMVDMETPSRSFQKKELLLTARNLCEKLEKKSISQNDWDRHVKTPKKEFIYKQFGSWKNFIQQMKELPPKFEYKLEKNRF